MKKKVGYSIFSILMFFSFSIKAQNQADGRVNTITSAVPFLMICPDSRAGGMGETGVATTPDVNSMHWNPAKYSFTNSDFGVALSYTPWLKNLADDINLSYLAGYKKIGKKQAIGASLRYFSLGNITFTNIAGGVIRDYRPHEFALDVSYSFLLSKYFSASTSLRYINSNLTGGVYAQDAATKPARTVAADLSGYYHRPIQLSGKDAILIFGLNISNMGAKVSYTDESQQDFIPTNMRLGAGLSYSIDDYNKINGSLEFNKLLIPTPPLYAENLTTGEWEIVSGRDPKEIGVASGIFSSFSDAPDGFKEELSEIITTIGVEYWYADQFAIRAGYFNEHQNKGNRKFLTFGLGLRLNVFGLDFAYLAPTSGRENPLAGTVRFSLLFNFEALSEAK